MSIIIDSGTNVIVQGITGREGSYHTRLMLEYGTNIIGGCTPGKGGTEIHGIPVYDTVEEVAREKRVDVSIILVPSKFAVDAVYEAADAGIETVICITENIPTLDTMNALRRISRFRSGTRVIGPNCPGVISPGKSNVSIMPGNIFSKGKVGIVSRSGTLTYQIAHSLSRIDIGQSTVVGIGGDQIIGTDFIDIVKMFEKDPQTQIICIIGEIGGVGEEKAAEYIKSSINKPVVAYVAGRSAPPDKTMGHAGAIVSGSYGSADSKVKAFEDAGAYVLEAPYEAPGLISKLLYKLFLTVD